MLMEFIPWRKELLPWSEYELYDKDIMIQEQMNVIANLINSLKNVMQFVYLFL